MRDRSRILGSATLMLLLTLLAAPASAEGPVIPLSADDQKAVALLGEGVVGKPVPAPTIEDVSHLVNLHDGSWEYAIISGDKKGKNRTEVYAKTADGTWSRNLGDDMIEYLDMKSGAWTKLAETDLQFNYRSDFSPPVHHAAGWKPGDETVIESDIKVIKVGEPDDIKYTGHMKSTITYVGAYEITVPAGTFPASLIKSVFDIKVGPANVTDAQYVFYAPGVGKVAEIESLSVSALFIYHSNEKTATVLTKAPGASK